ncbi:hypothetical protein P152DRAFT_438990 [Eremomyces bilateralis CBS 781.70]|uniref:peptidylprolyl isomerase n=1 Tax=Eremomyces bilateralis CBS 781.70 TaxID=1392243 RepID=A0A6G1FYD8_9PEZI|nr:uncharacterized protein P152DRAFT_438990 [Eremomyces bilateralis CBS 781.70]KAF1810732.1 hypothetical protein P152DRAFT_438990 [Eremomyces bilateralis CBS 781.70]
MSAIHVPRALFGLTIPCDGSEIPATQKPMKIRLTMAAIDPFDEPENDSAKQIATLYMVRDPIWRQLGPDMDGESLDSDDIEGIMGRLPLGMDSDEDMSDDDEESNAGPSDPAKAKAALRKALLADSELADAMDEDLLAEVNGTKVNKGKGKLVDMDISDDDESDDMEDDDFAEEVVICTLDPNQHCQQPLDVQISHFDGVSFRVKGNFNVHLTGNYVLSEEDAEEEEEEEDEEGMPTGPNRELLTILKAIGETEQSDEEDMYGDFEGESGDDSEFDELDNLQAQRVTEVDEDEEEAPKLIKAKGKDKSKGKKRPAEEDEDINASLDDIINKSLKPEAKAAEQPLSKKQQKKLKNNAGQAVAAASTADKKDAVKEQANGKSDKKVQFAEKLEQGPTNQKATKADAKANGVNGKADAKAEKGKPVLGVKTIQGVKIDDKKLGTGPHAKKGDRVGMRYIGKLDKNGKVFDANKSGKPFMFKLGTGEVIKGWDIGIVGMNVGGERRITIPANLAYGSQSIPGIPANSTLVFDIKMISIN